MSAEDIDIVGQLDALRRYARVLTRDPEGADDLVQATLLRAHERRSSFREGGDVRVWLMSIMHNLFVDERRSTLAAEAREQAWAELHQRPVAPAGEAAARLSQLMTAFLSLSGEQREALHLVAVEGLDIAAAAAVLDLPAGTVMSRVGRARAALRTFEDGARPAPPRALRIVGGRHD
ncbi:RNA polymerase subunit sigma [Acuticoccus sediminis]|uniref:RNA polymerase subunit sigma n=1 Tax=Acuticoccus sediminis TaxID=2184697 RepID=A0A8B2NEV5_9HYPH|nr:sigma-70 family RNA polymerase sigma factor [Acuticoccus sediminis]RAH97318.1 RNA polymerase subunit sigma [Acuticoccus sediminis]